MFPWQNLSDGELRARLLQRGVHEDVIDIWIEHRDDPISEAGMERKGAVDTVADMIHLLLG